MENKLEKQLEQLISVSNEISENTELYKYIEQITNLMQSDGVSKNYKDKYGAIVQRTKERMRNNPFLSVILRSQGNRPEGLREALLCLRAQTNQDFEVILIGHKATDSGKKCIKEIIQEQPENFRNRINYIELDEGTRTTPINLGFANANGQYVSIFDDDDLLFDNWVEKFYDAAKEHNGNILHAFALAQKWKAFSIDNSQDEEKGYVSIEAPTSQFCVKFDFLTQLVLNRCPLMSLAFPVYLFQDMGIIFNEELNVTEDWEYFMRVAPIAGISDIEEATSIYRLWINTETSATLHSQDTWQNTYSRIQSYMNSRQLLVPRGYTQHIVSLINRCNNNDKNMPLGYPKLQGILFYGVDWNFSDERMVIAFNNTYAPEINMEFQVPTQGEQYNYFRIDPSEFGGYILENIKILMLTEEGGEIEVRFNECKHNGFQCERGIYYMHYDPQISWFYEGKNRIVSIKIIGNANMEVPEQIIKDSIKQDGMVGKVCKKCKGILKEAIGRQ